MLVHEIVDNIEPEQLVLRRSVASFLRGYCPLGIVEFFLDTDRWLITQLLKGTSLVILCIDVSSL